MDSRCSRGTSELSCLLVQESNKREWRDEPPPATCELIFTGTFQAGKSRRARIHGMRNLGGGNDVTGGSVNAVGTAAADMLAGWAELSKTT